MLKITDTMTLNALLHAILVLKYELGVGDPSVEEICTSPFISSAANKIYDALAEAAHLEGNLSMEQMLLNSRSVATRHNVIDITIQRASLMKSYWTSLSRPERERFVLELISPYDAEKSVVEYMVEAVTSLASGGGSGQVDS
jgi:hypothetical protein